MILDIHTHVGAHKKLRPHGSWSFWGEMTVERLLDCMDAEGIDKAVVLPIESLDHALEGFSMPTEYILDACKASERLLPFCSVDPRDAHLADRIRRYVEAGCLGFGEHKVKLRVDDPRSKIVYETCGRFEVPILLHMDDTWNPDLEGYERVLQEFSSTVFIAHGPGWWRDTSGFVGRSLGGYKKGCVEPGENVDRILKDYPNAYADISAGSGYTALSSDTRFTVGFLGRNHRKLLFGTDLQYHWKPLQSHLGLLKLLQPKIGDGAFRAITYENARTLLRLR